MIHELKTWPEHFKTVLAKERTFEFRENDRNFKVGDILLLREYNPFIEEYTGRICKRFVTYILININGLPPNYCIMSIKPKSQHVRI